MGPEATMVEAGKRAAWWYLDTGDCFFCSVDEAPLGHEHQEHCTFFGIFKESLREWLRHNPMEFGGDGKPTK